MSAIAKLYAEKVKNGEKTIEEVPERWREEVRKILDTKSSSSPEESESTNENTEQENEPIEE